MDLSIWGGTEEIESSDSDCLVVLAYLRLGNCPINISTTVDNPDTTSIPCLIHGSNKILSVPNILSYLRRENYGLEYNLSDVDSSMLESLVTSIERRITPAVRWFLWADPSVYHSYTSKYYGSLMSWFHGFYHLRRCRGNIMRNAENSQITHCTKRHNRPSDIESSLYEGAMRCLTALSYILGSNKFFLANQPTAVDAYLFGRLWPLLNYDLQRNSIKDPPARLIAHIYQCENLFNHCQRIQRMCFPTARFTMRSGPNAQTEAEVETANQSLLSSSSAWLRSRPLRDGIFFGAFVLTVMAVFAVRVGIVHISTEDEDGEGVGTGGDHEEEEEPEFLPSTDN
nr:unnamed protein product [Spirometra erinaceieuropaei]